MMNTMLEKKTPWWSEPMVWLIIALPLAAVIGGITTVMIAYRYADTPAMGDYAKVGKGFEMVVDRDRKAAELAVGATMIAEPGRLALSLDGNFATPPENLILTLAHPTNAAMDMVLQLNRIGENEYAAAYASVPAGKRYLELSPSDKSWRITGQWQAPFVGSTLLAVANQLSSPQHSSTQP
ncbi:MAG: FixH family protein [Hydrogenophilaceae bacterium]